MGRETNISWCHHTLNAWEGCEKISPGCKNCYAATMNHWLHAGENWGPGSARRFFGDEHWSKPLRWNNAARKAGERRRVFCNSIGDVFEDLPELVPHRARLWGLVKNTPDLDWLMLTKRPENFEHLLPWGANDPWFNVWLGVTAENDEYAKKRIPLLQKARAAKRFVSYEPALGPIDWDHHLPSGDPENRKWCEDGRFPGHEYGVDGDDQHPADECMHCGSVRGEIGRSIDWVIFGDESGRGRRPAELDWARTTRDACAESGVAFHFKQWCGELEDGVDGDRVKKKIHLPMLDGQRHAEFPS